MPINRCLETDELQGMDPGDVARVQEMVDRFAAEGQTPRKSELSAANAVLSEMYKERNNIASQVAAKGGMVPTRGAIERNGTLNRGGMSRGQVRATTDSLIPVVEKLGLNGIKVIGSNQVETVTGQELPVNPETGKKRTTASFIYKNDLYIVHDNIPDLKFLVKKIYHEIVSHLGAERVMKEGDPKAWAKLVREYKIMRKGARFKDIQKEMKARYGEVGEGALKTEEEEFSEFLAVMAERMVDWAPAVRLFRKALTAVVEGLRKMGLIRGAVTMSELDGILARAESSVLAEEASAAPVTGELAPQMSLENDGLHHQIPLKYIVESKGPKPDKPSVLKAFNPNNQKAQAERLTALAERHPDPLKSASSWLKMERDLLADNRTPPPPYRMISLANNVDRWAKDHSRLSPGQLKAAGEGFEIVEEMSRHYESGTPTEHDTGKLMLWGMLSRMMSAHPHESAFLDAVLYEEDANGNSLDNFIQSAVDREWTDADVKSYLDWASGVIPDFAPGKQGTSNLNDFGKIFLKKLSKRNEGDGRSQLSHLHDLFSDRSVSSADVRRGFYGLGKGLGIKNKVLSFALLMSGRKDVVILDRIQINTMWDAGRYGQLIYDDVATLFDEGHGLARYEALERSLLTRIDDMYAKLGRPEDASVGRYHWKAGF